jgi:acyl-CoA thioester hydrolase
MRSGVLDFEHGETIGLVVETQCNYFASIVFPERIDAGLRVAKLGTTSVRYEVAIFSEGGEQAAAQGHFVHVYVDRETRRPVKLPEAFVAALKPLVIG